MKPRDLLGLDTVIGATFSTTAVKPLAYVAPVRTTTAPVAPAPVYVAPKVMTTAAAPVTAAQVFTPKPTMSTTAPTAPAVPAPKPMMTSSKPLTANVAEASAKKAADDKARAEAKARRQAAAARLGQRLAVTANKLAKRFPTESRKLLSIANIAKQRANIVGGGRPDFFASVLGELVGLEMTATALTTEQWFDYEANIGAVATCGDVVDSLQPLVDKLTQIGQSNLAGVGSAIISRCRDVITNFNPDTLSASSVVRAIQSDAQDWTAQATSALAAAPPLPPAEEPPPADAPAGGGDGGGGGGGGGGGEAEAAPDAGGGGEADGEGDVAPQGEPADFASQTSPGDAGAVPGGGETTEFAEAGETAAEEPTGYTDEVIVRSVQKALVAKGYTTGDDAEGVFGEGTAEAIRQMQAAEGLPATGVIDDAVLAALGLAAPAATDLFAAIVGELEGRPRRSVGASAQVIPKPSETPAPTTKQPDVPWLNKPMWTGSKVQIWHGAVGAGAAIAVSGILLVVLRRKK